MSPASGTGWIVVHLDTLLNERNMTLTELAKRINLTQANLSILKTGKAKAIRFSTLMAICRELECQPGDLLTYTDITDPVGVPPNGALIGAGSNVVLLTAGAKEIAVIKTVRQETGMGLKQAKELVEAAPVVVATGLAQHEAETMMVRLRRAGAKAEVT